MVTSDLRQRHTTTVTAPAQSTTNTNSDQQQANVMNIPSNYLNAFYGAAGTAGSDANSVLAQQYAMQTWMQQAYTQYMSQYMSLLSSPEAFYNMHQQQQTQQPPNFAFLTHQMPFMPPNVPVNTSPAILTDASTPQSPNNEAQPAPPIEQPAQQGQVEAQQRRFPNIIQDEQEHRDWLDILYSMSRLMILLCLVYFYSSPVRCLVVILVGVSIYLYHIYKQNQNRLNNNNSTRANLNVNRPPVPDAVEPQNDENPERTENESDGASLSADGEQRETESETEPLTPSEDVQESIAPHVSFLTVARTFVLSFLASIIPEAPAL